MPFYIDDSMRAVLSNGVLRVGGRIVPKSGSVQVPGWGKMSAREFVKTWGEQASAQGKAAAVRYTGKRNPGGHVTKAAKREKTRKVSAKRRVALALAKFLKQANPGMKTVGAEFQRLKRGVLKITPIKAIRKATRGRK